MRRRYGILPFSLLAASAALAADEPDQASRHLDALGQCRTIAGAAERATCYDRAYDALIAARDRKEVIVVDREAVREARRGLFGLNLPSLRLFGNDDDKAEEINEIDSTVQGAAQGAGGAWVITLADGARWRQIDDKFLMPPKPGQSVNIRKGSFGAYFARVNGKNGVKVIRVN